MIVKALGSVVVIAAAVMCYGCNIHGSNSADVTLTTAAGHNYSPEMSDNAQPIFDDDDGEMARLYKQNGYEYTQNLESAAASGDQQAQILLASMYAYGIGGVRADRKRAYCLYRSLAEAGDAESQAITGYMMLYGFGPVEDTEAGLGWLVEAANNGSGWAYYILGNFYTYNVEFDERLHANAKLYYRMAAERGVVAAQEELDRLSKFK